MEEKNVVSEKNEEDDCSICFDTFTKQTRKEIECPKCNVLCCRACVKDHIKTNESEPQCSDCGFVWSELFLIDNLPKTFVHKDIRKIRTNVELEKQKSLLPSTVPHVEEYNNRIKRNKRVKELFLLERVTKHQHKLALKQSMIDDGRRKKAIAKRNELRKLNKDALESIRNERWSLEGGYENSGTAKKAQFVFPCSYNDCKGFLSTKYKCGVCERYTCSKCFISKSKNHKCKENDILSAKHIKKSTKHCPSCGANVFRISGCAQMFCTHCNTAFSWTTGKIVTGRIHNPHYFEYIRMNNEMEGGQGIRREVGDIPCGGIPDMANLIKYLYIICIPTNFERNSKYLKHPYVRTITNINAFVYQLNNRIGNSYTFSPADLDKVYLDKRVDYLLNKTTDKQWTQWITRTRRRYERKTHNREILETYFFVVLDKMRTLKENLKMEVLTNDKIQKFIDETDVLADYCNTSLQKVNLALGYKNWPKIVIKLDKNGAHYYHFFQKLKE